MSCRRSNNSTVLSVEVFHELTGGSTSRDVADNVDVVTSYSSVKQKLQSSLNVVGRYRSDVAPVGASSICLVGC